MKILSAIAAIFLFVAADVMAQTTNTLSDAEIEGRALAQKILEQKPTADFTQYGILKVRNGFGVDTNFFILFQTQVDTADWQSVYIARRTTNDEPSVQLKIIHTDTDNKYRFFDSSSDSSWNDGRISRMIPFINLRGAYIAKPFMNSDFWFCDLGLEFFHWPAQKILKKEIHRSRGCTVLESTNPNPSPNGYSRVVSWIDNESLGIVEAYAYDANGKKLKDFYPKDFKKVDGQWQVQTLVMENVQTGSRSRLEFDLKK